jgi:hypothetical protein
VLDMLRSSTRTSCSPSTPVPPIAASITTPFGVSFRLPHNKGTAFSLRSSPSNLFQLRGQRTTATRDCSSY